MNIRHLLCAIVLLLIGTHTSFAQYDSYQLSTLVFVAKGEYSLSTKEDIAKAQYELGLRFAAGRGGVSRDMTNCLYWMAKAGENGLLPAQQFLVSAYNDGELMSPNYKKAHYWLTKAAAQNDHLCSLFLGKMYLYGRGCDKDDEKAAQYFKDAAFGEQPEGMYYYSLCFAAGVGVKVDTVKAVFWGDRAIEKGEYRSCFVLGNMYSGGESESDRYLSYTYLTDGWCYGDDYSTYLLGKSYIDGSCYLGKNVKYGMELLVEVSDKGFVRAMKELAYLYGSKDSEVYNMTEATMWYQRLVDKGELDYAKPLIEIYEGNGNYLAAASVYQTLLKEGEDVEALKALADYFANGKGVSQNYDEALSYINRAIEVTPHDIALWDAKGEILLNMGDVKSAKKMYKLIVSADAGYFGRAESRWCESFVKRW